MAKPHPQTVPCTATRALLRADHVAWLNPKGSVGRVWIGRKTIDADGDEIFVGETVDPAEAARSPAFADADYSSLNTFWGRRRSGECLKSVGSLVMDFDYNQTGLPFDGWAPEAVRDVLVAAIEAAGIPQPSIWVASGRNVQATYGCEGVKAAALARVEAVYDALYGPDLATNGMPKAKRKHDDAVLDAFEARMLPLWRTFRNAGLDRVCRDGARVVRLVGSINAKNGVMARLITPAAFADATRYDFHALANSILPRTRAEILELRRARAEAKAAAPANDNPAPARPRRHAGPTGRWVGILRDLHAWRDGLGAPPVGKRELWIFLTANATAHVRGGSREDWAAELAPLAGLSEREAFRALGSLDRRQRRHEAGETDEYQGVEQSVLYNHAAATIVDLLDIKVEQAEAFGLRALFPGGGKALTPAERQEARRRRAGAEAFDEAVTERVWKGIAALTMRADGMGLDAIAAELGLRSRDPVIAAMRDASQALGLGGAIDAETWIAFDASFEVSPAEAEAVEDVVDGPSRYIVGSASRDARPAPDAPAIAAGTVRVIRHTALYAVVVTATGTWSWTRIEGATGVVRGWHDEFRVESGMPLPADVALAEAALLELSAGRGPSPASARRSVSRRSRPARPAPAQPVRLAPLDLQREAELYREASGGGLRHRLALVAA